MRGHLARAALIFYITAPSNFALAETYSHEFAPGVHDYIDYYTFTISGESGSVNAEAQTSIGFASQSNSSLLETFPAMEWYLYKGDAFLVDRIGTSSFSFGGLSQGDYTLKIIGHAMFAIVENTGNQRLGAANYSVSVTSSPAPEPVDLVLTSVGLVGVGFMIRRNKAKKQILPR